MRDRNIDVETGRYLCDGITRRARACKRTASRHFERSDGVCVAHYCAQHATSQEPMGLLGLFGWEYATVREYR